MRPLAAPRPAGQNALMWRRLLKACLPVLLLLLLPARVPAFIDMAPPTTTLTVNWAGGDITRTVDFCVISVAGNQQSGTTVLPYDITVTSSTNALTLTGPGTAIPVAAGWTDLVAGPPVTLTLAHGVASSRTLNGAIDPCPGGNNGRATLTLLATDLYTRAPGTYSATFTYRARNAAVGKKRDTAVITLNVVIPTVLHVSGLNSIDLGTWDGLSPMTGSDALCVFINSGVNYTVTATGSGIGGSLSVSNGAVAIAFDATWDDGGGAVALLPLVALANRGGVETVSVDCNAGTTNTAVFAVSVPLANLQSVTGSGTFDGTVTLTVQAQ